MTRYANVAGLRIAARLHELVEEAAAGVGLDSQVLWRKFADIIRRFAPENRTLLEKREQLQTLIDQWHQTHPYPFDSITYENFLKEIGYLQDEGEDFKITTENVDDEIARIAGPQLVVPLDNARFALNAANARWGSLYDALYGSDVLDAENGAKPRDASFSAERARQVMD